MPADPSILTDDDLPADDQEYEDLFLSVALRIAAILADSDDEDPDPESSFL